MDKLYLYGAIVILIVLGVWKYTSMAEENGELTQANSTLNKAVEDGQKENKKLKAVAKLNADTVAKVSKEKNILNTYALKKAHELELLKYENAEIKKWSVGAVPYVLSGKLFGLTDNDDANGLYITADGTINANGGTEIEVRNEALYNYANDLESALLSCNVDKAGLVGHYAGLGIVLQ